MRHLGKMLCLILFVLVLMSGCGKQAVPPKEKIEDSIENAEIANPQDGVTWQEQYDLGMRYLIEGNYQEAIIAFTAAIQIDPKQAEAFVGRGDAYAAADGELRDLSAAIQDYSTAIGLSPNDYQTYIKRGNTYIASGETEDTLNAAQKDYEEAIRLDMASAEAYLDLADVYIRRGDYDKAMEILRSGLEKTGNDLGIANKIKEIENGNIKDSMGKTRRSSTYGEDGRLLFWEDRTYNEHGDVSSVSVYKGNGESVGHVDYEYDAAGHAVVTSSAGFNYGGGNVDYELHRVVCTYDDNGNCVKSETYLLDGELKYYHLSQYDDTGREIRRECYRKDGSLYYYDTYQYNSINEVSHRERYVDGLLRLSWNYEYDGNGNLLKNYQYDANGNLEFYHVYEYDMSGKKTKMLSFDSDGKLMEESNYD